MKSLRFFSSSSSDSRALRRATSSDSAGPPARAGSSASSKNVRLAIGPSGPVAPASLPTPSPVSSSTGFSTVSWPALPVVLPHAEAGAGERLPHRDARVLVEIGLRLAERLHEEAREHRLVALDAAVGGGDDDAPFAGQARQERRARRRGVDEDDLAADRRDQRLPVGGLEVGPDQVELGVDAVEGGVADQDDQQQVVLLEHRREPGERGADLVARGDVDVVADGRAAPCARRRRRRARGCDPAASSSRSRSAVASSSRQSPCWVRVLGAAGRAGDDDGVALRRARRRGGGEDGEGDGSRATANRMPLS